MFKQQRTSGKVALVLIAALVVGLCFETTALAKGGHGGSSSGRSNASSRSNASRSNRSVSKAGKSMSGKMAKGHHSHHRNHHWSSSRYFAQYGCTLYYDTDEQCWYYWCQPDDCYYPLSYCPYGTYSW